MRLTHPTRLQDSTATLSTLGSISDPCRARKKTPSLEREFAEARCVSACAHHRRLPLGLPDDGER